jgi:hypothetical protein
VQWYRAMVRSQSMSARCLSHGCIKVSEKLCTQSLVRLSYIAHCARTARWVTQNRTLPSTSIARTTPRKIVCSPNKTHHHHTRRLHYTSALLRRCVSDVLSLSTMSTSVPWVGLDSELAVLLLSAGSENRTCA